MKRIFPFLEEYKYVIVTLLVVAIIGDILLISFNSDLILFIVLGLVIFFFKIYDFSAKRIFILCFIPIAVMFILFFIDLGSIGIEKAATWLFLLLGTGIGLELIRKDGK